MGGLFAPSQLRPCSHLCLHCVDSCILNQGVVSSGMIHIRGSKRDVVAQPNQTFCHDSWTLRKTRMHSSRMRTVCSSDHISGVCSWGGVCSQRGLLWGVSAHGGCLLPRGVYSGGCLLPGVSALWGSTPGGSAPGGVSALGGVVSHHALRQTPLLTDTHL